jgi:hypothetical protein
VNAHDRILYTVSDLQSRNEFEGQLLTHTKNSLLFL